jgi:general stress protein 26
MQSFPLPDDLTSSHALRAIYESCWELLAASAAGSEAGWRLPVLATQSMESCHQRTVVLRRADADRAGLLFHTDVRSTKIAQIQGNPRVSLLFYDHRLAVQLQVTGIAVIHESHEIADQLWSSGTPASLKMYLGPTAPGTVCSGPNRNLPDDMLGRLPERDEIEQGRVNFAAIQVHVQSLEWLMLSRDGNLRARFIYYRGQLNRMEWLAP